MHQGKCGESMKDGRKDKRRIDIHIKKKAQIRRRKVKNEAFREKDSKVSPGKKQENGSSKSRTDKKKQRLEKEKKSGSLRNNLVKAAEAEGIRAASEQIEGGEELKQSSALAIELLRPVTAMTVKGTKILKESTLDQKRRKYKVVSPVTKNDTVVTENGINKSSKAAREDDASIFKKHSVKTGNRKRTKSTDISEDDETVKGTRKAATKGGASSDGERTTDYKETKDTVRTRKINSFLEKRNNENAQKNSVLKRVRDLWSGKEKIYTGKTAIAMFWSVGGVLGLILLIAISVVVIVSLLYTSPLALFLPSLSSENTVQSVTSTYVTDFITEVETLAKEHAGYDEGEICYSDPNGNIVDSVPLKDIMCVYMVKYGVGDTASVMDDNAQKRLKGVVDDMCQYTTSDRIDVRKNEKGKKYDVEILEVNVIIKDYQYMITEYQFSQDQIELIEVMMNL